MLIGVVLSPRTDIWGAVTNTGYNGMPTSFGFMRTLIRCLRQGSLADKLRTSRCPSVSVADITDCTTSPTVNIFERILYADFLEGSHLSTETESQDPSGLKLQVCVILNTQCLIGKYFCKTGFRNSQLARLQV